MKTDLVIEKMVLMDSELSGQIAQTTDRTPQTL